MWTWKGSGESSKRKRRRDEDQEEYTSLTTSNIVESRKPIGKKRTKFCLSKSEATHELCKVLKDKYRKPVLSNEGGSALIFNICTRLCIEDVEKVLDRPYVDSTTAKLRCNQYSLSLHLKLDMSRPFLDPGSRHNTQFALDWVALREFAKAKTYEPPAISSCLGVFHATAYEALNSILEIIHFVLFTANVQTVESIYQNKKPFYNVIIRLSVDQVIPATILVKIKSLRFEKGKLKALSLVFDKNTNSMKIIARIKF